MHWTVTPDGDDTFWALDTGNEPDLSDGSWYGDDLANYTTMSVAAGVEPVQMSDEVLGISPNTTFYFQMQAYDDDTGAASLLTPTESVTTLSLAGPTTSSVQAASSRAIYNPQTFAQEATWLYGMNRDGSDPTVIAQIPASADSAAEGMALSADGTEVAYDTADPQISQDTPQRIWIQPIAGGSPTGNLRTGHAGLYGHRPIYRTGFLA